jgi:hypothetical protein
MLPRPPPRLITKFRTTDACSETQLNFSPCSTPHLTVSTSKCRIHTYRTFTRRTIGHCLGTVVVVSLSLSSYVPLALKCSVYCYSPTFSSVSLLFGFKGLSGTHCISALFISGNCFAAYMDRVTVYGKMCFDSINVFCHAVRGLRSKCTILSIMFMSVAPKLRVLPRRGFIIRFRIASFSWYLFCFPCRQQNRLQRNNSLCWWSGYGSPFFLCCKRRHDFELITERVSDGIPVLHDFHLPAVTTTCLHVLM